MKFPLNITSSMWHFLKPQRLFLIQVRTLKHKLKIMETAYFRHVQDEDQFDLILKFTDQSLGIDRQFNFKRQISENLETLLTRIGTNIDKVLSKKHKKKTPPLSPVSVDLLAGNGVIDRNLTCNEVFKLPKLQLKIQDTLLNIQVNTPWVEKIALPDCILAGFPVYPNKFNTCFTQKDKSIFRWHKSVGKDWEEVGSSFFYVPTANDIGCKLRLSCKPGNGIEYGPEVEIESSVAVEAGPGKCPFETRHLFTQNQLNGNEFRVVTYNILADLYCDSDYTRDVLHPYCPPYALAINYRKQLILKELTGYNADLICLQEVDEKVFQFELLPVLEELAYNGTFHRKGGTVSEGLCLFYNNRFNLKSTETIVLGAELPKNELFRDLYEKVKTNQKFCERVLPRSQALQCSVLEFGEEIIVVGNTHLYFHADSDHIRLFQAGMIVRYMEDAVKKASIEYPGKRVSVMMCGDWNSVPECGIYQLMTTGYVGEHCIDWESNSEEAIKNLSLKQPFMLQSAAGTPKFTNFTAGFAACLDYIFYDTTHLEVTQVIPFPLEEELRAHTALPSIVFPSDHIAVISDLKFK